MELVGRLAWLVAAAALALAATVARCDPQVPCYFIFGDSLVDNGNNNYIVSLARANYPPYGIDFAGGPSGRFTNGLTTVDVIAQLLGFDNFIPPYAATGGDQLLNGVNFASAAAGIRAETGQQLGGRIPFAGQVQNYQTAVQTLVNILGDRDTASERLSQCIFTVGMGSNDYLNNYFQPAFYSTGSRYTPEQFADSLIADYRRYLQAMYSYGARKVALIGVGQVGCAPNELARYSPDGATCVGRIDSAIQIFNRRLVGLVDQMNALPGAHFTYINAYNIFADILANAAAYGFTESTAGCCGVGRNNGEVTCLPYQAPCANRDQHIFWDAFHPSEAANIIVGRRSYRAQSPNDAYPMDISTLASL
ncbi:GDSL esterase/lipase At5g45670-like [Triticum dicoccoides]|uniref:GDSL esterase/lipase n=2 Tax=Triticum TaxID=4564 RepID=A0A9R0RNA9_TRITD|nr:GDSL esterase/lipase At5g45670-like [Triticum dicoccoides]XP_044341241.1 GDSL esterase/lipase At5g45670-like [Triticum aestivum]VAH63728.1 unnamed protein product [Triticum turgidum subsp. durum]